ncbi:MAG: hypothetical protein AB1916_08225 [Thermodesulfobacteriota bacterium]
MNRRISLLLACAALLAGLAFAACASRGEPDAAYLENLSTWNPPRLLHERNALRAEENALAARIAETRVGDLPPTAREAATRSLQDSLATVQAKRRAVDEALASGRHAREELRYPVQRLVLRAEPAAPPDAGDPASAGEAATPGLRGPAVTESASQAPNPRTAEKPASRIPAPAPAASGATPPAPPQDSAPPEAAPPDIRPMAASAAETPQSPAVPARVLEVATARTAEGLEVRVRLEGNPARRLFTLGGPPRIVLDIAGVAEPAFRLFNRTLGAVEARSLRLGWHEGKALLRLVLDTDAAHLDRAALEAVPDGLVLRVRP